MACRNFLNKISEWAEKENVNISQIKKIGGGFINLVLMITTDEGKEFVIKNFIEEEEAINSRRAQIKIEEISRKYEKFIPKILKWIDEEILVSEKAEGQPISKVLREASPENIEETKKAFYKLGATLGKMHERTEIKLTDEDKEGFRVDREKLIKHLQQSWDNGFIDLTEDELKSLNKSILSITDSGFYSLIQGDAHLDQFFYSPHKSLAVIVDYDSVAYGDPMADIGRVLSSIRYWSKNFNLDQYIELEVEKSLMSGYRCFRHENTFSEGSEFNQKKILVYELRLSLIQLKRYVGLKDEIKPLKPLDLLNMSLEEINETLKIKNDSKLNDIKNFIYILRNANEISDYLKNLNE